jgi:DNA-directed RNA polymerase subunit beta
MENKTAIKRHYFGAGQQFIDVQDLIEIQKRSYERFLQLDVKPSHRDDSGLQSAFLSVFPIEDYNGNYRIDFLEYSLGEPKYEEYECLERGMTFAAPLKIKIRIAALERNKDLEKGASHSSKESSVSVKYLKEEEKYLGDLPLMTSKGTFIINGTERVVVSQLHRSPGVFFSHDKTKTRLTGTPLFTSRIIPYRGSWIDFEYDQKDNLFVRIDRKKKFPASILLKAMGITSAEIIKEYYHIETLRIKPGKPELYAFFAIEPGSTIPFQLKDHDGLVFREDIVPSDPLEVSRLLKDRTDLTLRFHGQTPENEITLGNIRYFMDGKSMGILIPVIGWKGATTVSSFNTPELNNLLTQAEENLHLVSMDHLGQPVTAKTLLSSLHLSGKQNETLLHEIFPFAEKSRDFIILRPTQVFRSLEILEGDSLPFKIWTRSLKEDGDRVKTSDEVVYQDKVTKFTEELATHINSHGAMGTMHSKSKKFYPLSVEKTEKPDKYRLLEAIPDKEIEEFYSAEDILDPQNPMDVILSVGQRVIEHEVEKSKAPVLTNLLQRNIVEIKCYSVPSNQRARTVVHQTLSLDKTGVSDSDRARYIRFLSSTGVDEASRLMGLVARFMGGLYTEYVISSKVVKFVVRPTPKSLFKLITRDGETILGEGIPITPDLLDRIAEYSDLILIRPKTEDCPVKIQKSTDVLGNFLVLTALRSTTIHDIQNQVHLFDLLESKKGVVLKHAGDPYEIEDLDLAKRSKLDSIFLAYVPTNKSQDLFVELSDLAKYPHRIESDPAVVEIYKRIRPGEVPHVETARAFFEQSFFNSKRYDLSSVGRLKLNSKLGVRESLNNRLLSKADIVEVIRYMVDLLENKGEIDDIDHLGNRRVRSVGELLENQFRIGLVRMERAIKERLNLGDPESIVSSDPINVKPVTAIIKEFFGSSQLSQFMDQTNPLAEVTHKRRLSALGPGGLTRERAGFEVRDVHASHYGRICPIETPEGPNIGLITSLATFARVNEFGFIESPVRVVEEGVAKPEIVYLSAMDGDKFIIAQASTKLDSKGALIENQVSARFKGDFLTVSPDRVQYIDVAPQQIVSVATALIPFLEHNDANRALMGSNMQRQAVPLLRPSAPLVGTGMEKVVARDSGYVIYALEDGEVLKIDGTEFTIKYKNLGVKTYPLIKFRRSNQNTCLNQKVLLSPKAKFKKGDVLVDGPSTERGDLAMGQNVLVAFMPWGGYNFEDAILISERLVRDDMFTSIHIEEFELEARETKQGKEEITRDIPNLSDEALRNLDESGIVRVGAEVKPGDILVGKVTPKAETQLTPEERLLRAIFGDKSANWKDASLTVPAGIEGIVVDVKILSRKGLDRDETPVTQMHQGQDIGTLTHVYQDELRKLEDEKNLKIKSYLLGKVIKEDILDAETGDVILKKKRRLTQETLDKLRDYSSITLSDQKEQDELVAIEMETKEKVETIQTRHDERIGRLKKGDELPPGVLKLVKVYVAMKRKLSVGDKMAGRHGNKGVVSRIVPMEDMPFLPDGTPVDIVLNPLGVPSRMNVGQILETHLGMAARALGIHFATPVFDGASENQIKEMLEKGKIASSGQTKLVDGKTGETFDRPVTVGMMYMFKLHHLVDDKIHARSIGPYSLVTQQPLGGKAQFGGQRLGEMEVWALQAYGAASTLQEFLTVKSDDVSGRSRMYEAIVRGDNYLDPGLPESFNVLIKELQSLALDIELLKTQEKLND